MSVSFEVAQVEPGDHRLESISVIEAIPRSAKVPATTRFEAASVIVGGVAHLGFHPFAAAIGVAYDKHLPLRLSPDQVWLVIAQGFANHVRLHSEALRGRLVAHQGRVEIVVRRDDFVRGAFNPWPEVFEDFAAQLRKHIGKRHDLVVADFSTTGPVERTVSQLVLMDVMQHYFDFTLVTRCGIPRITLTGTPDDWRSVRARAQVLREFDLDHWIDPLTPILDAFVDAAEGRVDREFWAAMCKIDDGSGGPYFSGWMSVLFPYRLYQRRLQPASGLASWGSHRNHGPSTSQFPGALASVPMLWKYLDTDIPMTLLGGFVGIKQHPVTLEVTPSLGWAIHDR